MKHSLNTAQLEAIQAPKTPHLVVAGAGTGKTTVLIERILYLIKNQKIDPQRIWVVTFTNKAINEVKSRLSEFCENLPNYISTFHGSCVWILRRDISAIGRNNNFKIVDQGEKNSIIKRILRNFTCPLKPAKVSSLISRIKNNSPEKFDFAAFKKIFDGYEIIEFEDLKKIYQRYCQYLEDENALDFDDLLNFTNKLLDVPAVKEYWNNFFEAILIDEFQDINYPQFELVRKVLGEKQNIFCVGDPDQSIYSFRGARPEICQKFLDIFSNSSIIKLEQNYRSTQKILNVANALINKNKTLFSKKLFTENEVGENVKYFAAYTEEKEAEWVLKELYFLMKYNDVSLSDCIVLYRNNNHAINLEKELIKRNIPYIIYGSVKFFERQEIKNMIAYLNLAFFEESISIERIINVPKRSIGTDTLERMINFCSVKRTSLYKELFNFLETDSEIRKIFSPAKVKNIEVFCELLRKIKSLDKKDLSLLIDKIFEISGYKKELEDRFENSKIENVLDFIDWIKCFQSNKADSSSEDIVREISLYASTSFEKVHKETLNLSTVHNSKGLEFDYVFVIKMAEKQFPHHLSLTENRIAEERRLAYVAFTRARKRLFLSASPSLDFLTGFQKLEESIFIKEIKFLPEFSQVQKNWN